MPVYEYDCPRHGIFEQLQEMTAATSGWCPRCGLKAERVISRPGRIAVIDHPALPLGKGSPGKYIPSGETGGLPVYVPSFGGMEKEEVDYVAGMAVQKERERVRKKRQYVSPTKSKLQSALDLAYKTKPGQRAKAIKEAMKG